MNRAQVGARFADIARQLEHPQRFDIILILGGGNDVIGFTAGVALGYSLRCALRLACERADTVVLMPAGNVGNTPFFSLPWAWLMAWRSWLLHVLARSAATSAGAVFVDGFRERADDPFVRESQRLNASDLLHPSDDGYQLWFGALQDQAALSARLFAIASARQTPERLSRVA